MISAAAPRAKDAPGDNMEEQTEIEGTDAATQGNYQRGKKKSGKCGARGRSGGVRIRPKKRVHNGDWGQSLRRSPVSSSCLSLEQ